MSNPTAEALQRVVDLRAQRGVMGLVRGSLESVAAGIRCWATSAHTWDVKPCRPERRMSAASWRASVPLRPRGAISPTLERLVRPMGIFPSNGTITASSACPRYAGGAGRTVTSTDALSMTAQKMIACHGIRSKYELSTALCRVYALRAQSECFRIRLATAANKPTDPWWFPSQAMSWLSPPRGWRSNWPGENATHTVTPACCLAVVSAPQDLRSMSKNACVTDAPYGLISARVRLLARNHPGLLASRVPARASPNSGPRSRSQCRALYAPPYATRRSAGYRPTRRRINRRHSRYTPRPMRRGAARAIAQHGGALTDVIRARGWKSTTFKLYLETTGVEAMATFDMPCALDDESALGTATGSYMARKVQQGVSLGDHGWESGTAGTIGV